MKMLAVKSFFSTSIIYYSNRTIPIYQNSYLAARLGGIEQKNHLEAQQLINKYISFVLFPQASEPSMNFNISKMVY